MIEIDQAVQFLGEGKLVAFPTETVYGVGADATNAAAVKRIFDVKGRPPTNPLIVHVADEQVAHRFAAIWPPEAAELTRQFWPGPLTLVVPKAESVVREVTAGRGTVGLRSPDHPLALELLRAFDGAIAAPSANRSNRVSPTTAQHVRDELGDAVDLILDGGPCNVGIESTVLDLTGEAPTILRPGTVTAEQIEQVIGRRVEILEGSVSQGQAATSPGQQAVHYAPRAAAYRFDLSQRRAVVDWCRDHCDVAWAVLFLGPLDTATALSELEPVVVTQTPPMVHKLIQMPASARDYARRLYATLREMDEQGMEVIWIQTPPEREEWRAVRDRIIRATREGGDLLGRCELSEGTTEPTEDTESNF